MLKINIHFKKTCKKILGRYGLLTGSLLIALLITLVLVFSRHEIRYYSFADEEFISKRDGVFFKGCVDTERYIDDPNYQKMNATFVMLTRNEEVHDVMKTMYSIETHFNQWFKYPYVFLNDEPFTDEFKDEIRSMTGSDIHFGTIDQSDWEFPEDIRNSYAFKNSIQEQGDRGILYGSMESYHKMCRFYSGIFYKHPLVREKEWYWRLEPDVEFFCDISYDPFYEMAKANKKYGFTVVLPEIYWTVPNLFRYTRSFIRKNSVKPRSLWNLFTFNYDVLDTDNEELSEYVNHGWDIEPKLSEKVAIDHMFESGNFDDDMGMEMLIRRSKSKVPTVEDKFDDQEYNMCHFWSNFEIARVDVFDNDFYNSYFQYLEESGGFWRERWGDAPVHSLGLGMMLDVDDIHYFRDIGYRHSEVQHCPRNWNGIQGGQKMSSGQLPYKEVEERFKRKPSILANTYDEGVEEGSGCRCKCSRGRFDIEDEAPDCIRIWSELVFESDSFIESSGHNHYINAEEVESRIKNDYQARKQ